MKANLHLCKSIRICPHRMPQCIRHAAAGLTLAACLAVAAQAATVTVNGEFLSFISDMGIGAYVNGMPLTSSGAPGSQPGYQLSNPVYFTSGTTSVSFRYDPAIQPSALVNSFQYAGNTENVNVGDTFRFGTFTFTNGQWFPRVDIAYRLTSASADPALNGHVFEGTLRLISVSAGSLIFPQPGDDQATRDAIQLLNAQNEADYFYILERPDLGSVRVYDKYRQPPGDPGFAESFALYGRIGSLVPTGWVALGGAGFTDPSVEPQLSPPSVPEPGTFGLFGIALLGLAIVRRK